MQSATYHAIAFPRLTDHVICYQDIISVQIARLLPGSAMLYTGKESYKKLSSEHFDLNW